MTKGKSKFDGADDDVQCYGLRESSQLLGVSLRKVCEMVASGQLASVRIGKRRVIRKSEIARYIEANTVAAFDATAAARGFFRERIS